MLASKISDLTPSQVKYMVQLLRMTESLFVSKFPDFPILVSSRSTHSDMVITPITRPARNLAALEGIFGQLYIAILITRLVSQYIRSNSQQKR